MDVWRVTKERYALDRVGTGASRTGGRWNPLNVPVIYAGMSIAIASYERLVHTEELLAKDLVLVKIEIPDGLPLRYVANDDLPINWDALPSSASAQAFGNTFVNEGQYLAIVVPSVVIPEERNIIINPNHLEWAKCTMNIVRPFLYDTRLAKA